MKLTHSLFTAAFLIVAAGCTATTSDSGDAATTGDTGSGGGDTGTGGGDTGTGGSDTAKADTGTVSETSSETGGGTCKECAAAHCSTEGAACKADAACQAGVACLVSCQTSDAGASDKSACENTCVSNAKNDNLNAYVGCLLSNCKDPCGL